MKIAILNGPNLNLIGRRDPKVYGHKSMEQEIIDIQRRWSGMHFVYTQSNHEGVLIDKLQEVVEDGGYIGVVLNGGGYAHTSVALRDAVEYVTQNAIPVVNIHISDIRSREAFRQTDLIADVSTHTIVGHRLDGYEEAVEHIMAISR